MGRISFVGADVFDGQRLYRGQAVVVEQGRIRDIGAADGPCHDLGGGLIVPGFLDLQVNGAGGVAVDGASDLAALATICATQARLGATGCMPTLITDTPQATDAVLAAGIAAAKAALPGFLGLHLEGPHLDPARAGAHDPALIRPMTAADLAQLIAARAELPALMVTLAPESTTPKQIAALAAAGVVVSLGHTACSATAARTAMAAGARCATHLFNAMGGITAREPGLAGTVLAGDGFAGLIADGIHVDPITLRVALAAKPDGVFLVTDCMALAGTPDTEMHLGGRLIRRENGRLTLADGTLAGADLTLAQAIRLLVQRVGIAPERALAMATTVPAKLINRPDLGRLTPGSPADMVHLRTDWSLGGVWRGGVAVGG